MRGIGPVRLWSDPGGKMSEWKSALRELRRAGLALPCRKTDYQLRQILEAIGTEEMEPGRPTVKRDVVVTDQVICDGSIGEGRCRYGAASVSSKQWRWAILLFFVPAIATSTSIVVVVGDRAITVGADAAQARVTSEGVRAVTAGCKIQAIGGYLFLTSGRTADVTVKTKNGSEYDMRQLMKASATRTGSIEAASAALRKAVADLLPEIVESGRQKEPDVYKLWIKEQDPAPVVSFIIGGVIKGVPGISFCDFKLIRGKPASQCDRFGPFGYIAIGTTEIFTSLDHRDRPGMLASAMRNPLQFVTSAVGLEVAASQMLDNDFVGGPIAAATFDSAGLHFAQGHAAACGAQDNKKK